ncbi:hypothetical protein B0H14DRAFT_1709427 [Mycena olivaceomarginata]|nr:hypothetical protein B0H14DRAFT_1709427 [Mycena olivaceomarginata]
MARSQMTRFKPSSYADRAAKRATSVPTTDTPSSTAAVPATAAEPLPQVAEAIAAPAAAAGPAPNPSAGTTSPAPGTSTSTTRPLRRQRCPSALLQCSRCGGRTRCSPHLRSGHVCHCGGHRYRARLHYEGCGGPRRKGSRHPCYESRRCTCRESYCRPHETHRCPRSRRETRRRPCHLGYSLHRGHGHSRLHPHVLSASLTCCRLSGGQHARGRNPSRLRRYPSCGSPHEVWCNQRAFSRRRIPTSFGGLFSRRKRVQSSCDD